MKIILYLLFFFLGIQNLDASPDSIWTVSYIEQLRIENRWPSISTQLNQLHRDEKKEKLEYIIQISESQKWLNVHAKAEQALGLFFYTAGSYADALNHYLNALTLFEELNDQSEQGATYHFLATLSKKQKDYKRAHQFLDKTLELCTQIKDTACISTVFDNRGLIYAEQKDFKKAKEYYLITLDLRKRLKDTIGLGYVYSNLAEVASNEQAYEVAENYLLESNVYKSMSSDRFGQGVNFTNLGELYFRQKKYHRAANFFQESLLISKELGIPDLSQWNYRFLSRCFSALGDTEQAFHFLNQSHQLKDSLLTVEKLSQITEMETKFDTERKEQKIKLQQLELENQRHRNRNQLMMAIGIGTILILGFLTFFMNFRNRQKNKMQKAQISYQQQLLSATIETQEKERLRISKDLHDGIGQLLSGLKMAWHQLEKTIKIYLPEQSKQLGELSHVLGDAADEVRSISHQMMPKSLLEYGLLAAVEDLLDKTFKNIPIQCDFDQHEMEGRFSQNIELSTYRILQELINNIIKHAQASEVSIQFIKNGY